MQSQDVFQASLQCKQPHLLARIHDGLTLHNSSIHTIHTPSGKPRTGQARRCRIPPIHLFQFHLSERTLLSCPFPRLASRDPTSNAVAVESCPAPGSRPESQKALIAVLAKGGEVLSESVWWKRGILLCMSGCVGAAVVLGVRRVHCGLRVGARRSCEGALVFWVCALGFERYGLYVCSVSSCFCLVRNVLVTVSCHFLSCLQSVFWVFC